MKKSTISFEAVIVAFVMLTMLILVFLGVISRYVLHFSFSFTEELVCAMFVLLSTMGGALASKENGHYTLDLITGMMKPKMKRVFLIIDTLLTCAAASVLLYTGIIMVKSQMKIGSLSNCLKDSKLGIRFVRAHWPGVYPVPQHSVYRSIAKKVRGG